MTSSYKQTQRSILAIPAGPLINVDGELIGVNTLIFSRSGGSQGIGFAIPSELAFSVLDEIVQTGRVRRGWLGVELAVVPGPDAPGLEVTRVITDGPAAVAGLAPGDIIEAINGAKVADATSASREIAAVRPGTEIALDVTRDGERLTVDVVSGERPAR